MAGPLIPTVKRGLIQTVNCRKGKASCKTLQNSIEHGASIAIKKLRVSPDITALIWMHCFRTRMTEWSLLGINTAGERHIAAMINGELSTFNFGSDKIL